MERGANAIKSLFLGSGALAFASSFVISSFLWLSFYEKYRLPFSTVIAEKRAVSFAFPGQNLLVRWDTHKGLRLEGSVQVRKLAQRSGAIERCRSIFI